MPLLLPHINVRWCVRHRELADAYREVLEASRFEVSTAGNGVQALKLVMDRDVDAIFCDLMMPEMAGDIFYVAVQRVKPHLCERFIFVTGYERHPQFAPFLQKIGAVVLYKPITRSRLLVSLNVLLKRFEADPTPPPAA
jgi:CheY-like chemotaxis protein